MEPSSKVDETLPLVIATPVHNDVDGAYDGALVVHEEKFNLPLPLALALPHSFPMFCHYHLRITEDELDFGYCCSMTSKKIQRSKIQSAVVIPNVRGILVWGGWGIRLNHKLEPSYICKNGPAVRITAKHGKRGKVKAYTFSCDHPEYVARILSSRISFTEKDDDDYEDGTASVSNDSTSLVSAVTVDVQ